jgi:hypothetical protein
MENVGAFFKHATFSDGTTVTFAENDILVLVGPNNAGKSVALGNLRRRFESADDRGRVVTAVGFGTRGSPADLLKWLEDTSYVYRHPGNFVFSLEGHRNINEQSARNSWSHFGAHGFGQLAPFFCRSLGTSNRLELTKPPENISLTSSAPVHPIHYLQRDDGIEKRVSDFFNRAFGQELIIHHNSGKDVPLYCGKRPQLQKDEDRLSAR